MWLCMPNVCSASARHQPATISGAFLSAGLALAAWRSRSVPSRRAGHPEQVASRAPKVDFTSHVPRLDGVLSPSPHSPHHTNTSPCPVKQCRTLRSLKTLRHSTNCAKTTLSTTDLGASSLTREQYVGHTLYEPVVRGEVCATHPFPVYYHSLTRSRKQWRRDHPFGFFAKPMRGANGMMDLKKWDCGVPGKEKTIWEGGLFKLEVTFPDEYPTKPPKCTSPQTYSLLTHR
jgi:hypothetical protein